MSFSGEGSVGGGLTDVFQCRTNSIAHHGRCPAAGLKARTDRQKTHPRDGVSLPSLRPRSPRLTRYRPSEAPQDHLRSWVLLASTSLQASDDTGDAPAFLAHEVRAEQSQGSSEPARPPTTGVADNGCLGMLDSPSRLAGETPARLLGGLKAPLRPLIRGGQH